ncbi:MAG: hypothetical protein J6K46_01910 [Sutterella sp.]|nr:hypothetical protein [Sutterella sp.]
MADNQNGLDSMNAEMDASNLYSEEVVTDRKVGTIRVLTPVLPTGARDLERPMIFMGEAQIMTQMGPLPITFEIPAQSVAEAVAAYGTCAKDGVRQTIEKIQAMRREAASQIVTPGMPGFQAPPAPGGSGIAMP